MAGQGAELEEAEEAEDAVIDELRKTGLFRIDIGGGDSRGRTLDVSFRRTPTAPVVWRQSVANNAPLGVILSLGIMQRDIWLINFLV